MSRLLEAPAGGLTYAAAGVSIEAGDHAVQRISSLVEGTKRAGVLGSIGGFGGLFQLDTNKYPNPVLVASADGVGTKLEIARLLNQYDTVGIDLVAMLVDDLACVGAEPLFVLDYVAVGKLDPSRIEEVVRGIAEGCRECGAALLGGETAEHGGVMRSDDLDVAGFALGVLQAGDELGPQRARDGDVLLGLLSPGLRSNGYTLARRALLDRESRLDEPAFEGSTVTLAQELLRPSVIYAPAIMALRSELRGAVHAVSHVTGGGIVGNVARSVPNTLDAVIDMGSFPTPEIFFEIQRRGHVAASEMVRVFNCGLGMTVAVDPDAADAALDTARSLGFDAALVGFLQAGSGTVQLR